MYITSLSFLLKLKSNENKEQHKGIYSTYNIKRCTFVWEKKDLILNIKKL